MVDNYPVINYKKCINCLCCNETCPEGAIEQKMSWVARRIS
ncbi:MAG: 4Fe-4S binding protein [bacterium]